jgi:hypothetical protein
LFGVSKQDEAGRSASTLIVTGIVLAGGPADDPSLQASFGTARRSATNAAPDEGLISIAVAAAQVT